MEFLVDLGVAASSAVTITWKTADGTAKAGNDYVTQTSKQLTIPAGQTTAAIRVPTSQDTVDEDDEGLTVEVERVTGGLAIGRGTAVGLIRDCDS